MTVNILRPCNFFLHAPFYFQPKMAHACLWERGGQPAKSSLWAAAQAHKNSVMHLGIKKTQNLWKLVAWYLFVTCCDHCVMLPVLDSVKTEQWRKILASFIKLWRGWCAHCAAGKSLWPLALHLIMIVAETVGLAQLFKELIFLLHLWRKRK